MEARDRVRVLVTETAVRAGLELLREGLPGRRPDRSRRRRPRRRDRALRRAHRSAAPPRSPADGARRGHEPEGGRARRDRPGQRRRRGGDAARASWWSTRRSPTSSRAAEQTLALLLAQARNIPQAHADLIDGRWERSKWEGVELAGKTIGLVGLGRVGSLVAARAAGFGMRVIAFDPYVSAERAKEMGVEIDADARGAARAVGLRVDPPAAHARDRGPDRGEGARG